MTNDVLNRKHKFQIEVVKCRLEVMKYTAVIGDVISAQPKNIHIFYRSPSGFTFGGHLFH